MITKNRNRDYISYCGLYCKDCPFFKGKIANPAKDLAEKLKDADFPRIAQGLSKVHKKFMVFKNYAQFQKVLSTISSLRCEKKCQDGGGESACIIKGCCKDKNIAGCWECGDFETCKRLAWIEPVNHGAYLKNIRKIRRQGIDCFLKGHKYW